MAVLKCKMCGGNIEVGENQNIGVCDSCGSTMTIPNVNDERILNLFDRANHFRLQNEFDKALAAYESILSEDNKNAEAHWGCVLSRYGIEYVKDPKTHKRVPTCHRVQNESVLSDLDYKAAVECTDDISAKNLYQQEAEAIAEIQKNILSIANNEAPYDIFICYKETDNSGRRTVDSALAQDIYYQLTNEGYKVFFSRITLEDKLGAEYEPYIFSALNSAKVMLVVGTNKDYFNAVWVKNEWARFLDLARKDKSKMIIPCYRDIDAYDLPDELSMYQSQDMGKIGFVQDLIRGIKKVLQKETPRSSITAVKSTAEAFRTEPLLKRAFMMLEDEEWKKANELLEQVLNHEPENAFAYLGKLIWELRLKNENELANVSVPLVSNKNYQKLIKFSDQKDVKKYEKYNSDAVNRKKIIDCIESKKKEIENLNRKLYNKKYPGLNKVERLKSIKEPKSKACGCATVIFIPFYIIIFLGMCIGVDAEESGLFVMCLTLGVILAGIHFAICNPYYSARKEFDNAQKELKKIYAYPDYKEYNLSSITTIEKADKIINLLKKELKNLEQNDIGHINEASEKNSDIYFQKPLY